MLTMAYKRVVLRDETCPRCNAQAQVRVDNERSGRLLVELVCSKCKLRESRGLTTRKAVDLESKIEKLQEALEGCGTPRARHLLEHRIFELRRAQRRLEMGLAPERNGR